MQETGVELATAVLCQGGTAVGLSGWTVLPARVSQVTFTHFPHDLASHARKLADRCVLPGCVDSSGARTAAGSTLCPVAAAKQALDTLLLQRQQQAVSCRCVVHSCLSPMPLAAPLSFPSYLLPAPRPSGRQSSLQGPQQAGGLDAAAAVSPVLVRSAKSPCVPAPGVFSRLTASSGFEGQLQRAARDLQRLGGYGAGRACLEEWGYAASDVDELRENLLLMAGRYSTDLD